MFIIFCNLLILIISILIYVWIFSRTPERSVIISIFLTDIRLPFAFIILIGVVNNIASKVWYFLETKARSRKVLDDYNKSKINLLNCKHKNQNLLIQKRSYLKINVIFSSVFLLFQASICVWLFAMTPESSKIILLILNDLKLLFESLLGVIVVVCLSILCSKLKNCLLIQNITDKKL